MRMETIAPLEPVSPTLKILDYDQEGQGSSHWEQQQHEGRRSKYPKQSLHQIIIMETSINPNVGKNVNYYG